MASYTYTNDIPFENNAPSVDQPNMKVNTNSIDSLIGEDHISFNTPNGGYHKIVHQETGGRTRSGAGAVTAGFPGAIANINQLFAADYTPDASVTTTDTELFSTSGTGVVSQLTGNLLGTQGWIWVSGILVQWGSITFSGGADAEKTVTVTFKDRVAGAIPFPNNCWQIVATLKIASTATSTASNTLAIRDFSTTQFRAKFNSSSSSGSTLFPGFHWVAIGN